MKLFYLTFVFILISIASTAQLKKFLLQGQVIDQNNNPVSDVYIVNLNSQEKDISKNNGVFTLTVTPIDTLVLSHISYYRKQVTVHELLISPKVMLLSENVDIQEVVVGSERITDMDRAQQNMEFLNEYQVPPFTKISEETNPVQNIATENNELMRSEAASVSLFRFSPSELVNEIFHPLKNRKKSSDYSSTKKLPKEQKK
jgi:hypothetical protein